MAGTYAVTGVASGIGAALAARLRADGHRVIGFDRREAADGANLFIPLDLGDPASIEAAAAQVDEPLDGLCNNAGLPPRAGLEATILQVNFLGQRQFTCAILPRLSDGGAIVNLASRAGAAWRENLDQIMALGALSGPEDTESFVAQGGIDATRAYNLSKEAMIAWTLALTEPMIRRGIRINSVSPGAVATGILDDFAVAFGERMARNVARAGRPGTPEEVAGVLAFLLSSESNWIKGVDVPIDGGMGGFNMADALGLATLARGMA